MNDLWLAQMREHLCRAGGTVTLSKLDAWQLWSRAAGARRPSSHINHVVLGFDSWTSLVFLLQFLDLKRLDAAQTSAPLMTVEVRNLLRSLGFDCSETMLFRADGGPVRDSG
jgi:hypothetical protein